MALFSKKKENAGELPQRESAPAQDQGTEQESAQAGGLTKLVRAHWGLRPVCAFAFKKEGEP